MDTALGLLGVAFFIACVISLAAGITWLVVKLSPTPRSKKNEAKTASE